MEEGPPMKIEGSCHCGFITYEAEVDPDRTAICHCTDCQTLSGSPFRVSVPAERKDFRLLSGEPQVYVKIGDSGSKRAQAFCPKCGAPIYATAFDDPNARVNLRVGAIRQRDQLVPKQQIWARSGQAWLGKIPGLPRFEKEPTH
jgi:hypothetical protein